MKRMIVVIALSVLMGAQTAAGASALTIRQAARQYLADVAPYNAAVTRTDRVISHWTTTTPLVRAQKDVEPLIKAGIQLQDRLLRQAWPKRARSAVRALYDALAPVNGYLSSLASFSVLNAGTFAATFSTYEMEAVSAANVLRHDLGLPLVTP